MFPSWARCSLSTLLFLQLLAPDAHAQTPAAPAPTAAPTTAPAPTAAPTPAPAPAPAPTPAPTSEPVPTASPTEPVPTASPAEPVPSASPSEPVPAASPAEPTPTASAAIPGMPDDMPDDVAVPKTAELQPRHRIIYANTLVARFNPLGVEDRVSFMYHRRLTTRHGKLWDDTHFGIGLTPSFAPSIIRLGGTAELVPLAILHLKASYYFISYFGSQEFKAHAFDSPNDDFSWETIKERSEAKQGLSTYGGQAELSALLQFKFGPIAVRNELTFFHNLIKLPGKNDVFYDLRHDVMAPAQGWLLGNDSDILYINQKIRLTAGVRATYFHMFYPDSVYEPGDVKSNSNDHARVGPLIAYTFKDRPAKRFMRPTLYLLAQWWVKHRYRTGQEINQGIPLLVLGFSFTGELFKKD
ncbi:MAG: hypothetical protein IPO88_31630 [Nannocystis sp.]|uniref:hypothetical protein n=1 Tax=Nannocystis sp. TaxID=1962667 RepID=UPI0024244661|nr:hypothetical protein [Nannocystis sp.]MBK9757988.1 hypothetical protein [Nannocystis sp.]